MRKAKIEVSGGNYGESNEENGSYNTIVDDNILLNISSYSNSVILSLAITFGTIAYHFIIRLLVGYLFDFKMKNQADYTKKWYQVSDTEMKLYQKLKVKTWKNKMPTFDMDVFDVSKHSWDEIIQATCQSELVHETNVVFSFLPVVAAIWFGSFEVFLITSMLGAIFDLMFVFMQRFNRARIVKMRRRR